MIVMQEKKGGGTHKFMHAYQGDLSYKDGLFNNRNVKFEQHQSINILATIKLNRQNLNIERLQLFIQGLGGGQRSSDCKKVETVN